MSFSNPLPLDKNDPEIVGRLIESIRSLEKQLNGNINQNNFRDNIEQLLDGSDATALHRHSKLHSSGGNSVASVNSIGDIIVKGNLGIGTSAPTTNIAAGSPVIDISGSDNPSLVVHDTDTTQEGSISTDGSNLFIDAAGNVTASGNNNIVLRTENDNSSFTPTARLTIDRAGKVDIPGFTVLGDTSPAIKVKTLSGTTDADSTTVIAHGLTRDKIISLRAIIFETATSRWYNENNLDGSNKFYTSWEATNAELRGVTATLQSEPFKVFIIYEE